MASKRSLTTTPPAPRPPLPFLPGRKASPAGRGNRPSSPGCCLARGARPPPPSPLPLVAGLLPSPCRCWFAVILATLPPSAVLHLPVPDGGGALPRTPAETEKNQAEVGVPQSCSLLGWGGGWKVWIRKAGGAGEGRRCGRDCCCRGGGGERRLLRLTVGGARKGKAGAEGGGVGAGEGRCA